MARARADTVLLNKKAGSDTNLLKAGSWQARKIWVRALFGVHPGRKKRALSRTVSARRPALSRFGSMTEQDRVSTEQVRIHD